MSARVGLYGGTFDPIHIGHLAVADTACRELALDHLIFIPGGTPPHKKLMEPVGSAHRFEMVKLATSKDSRFSVSNIETHNEGTSYSVDTVRQITARSKPGTRFFFILGDDAAAQLHRWKGLDELLTRVEFISVSRNDKPIHPSLATRVRMLSMPTCAVSSTELRIALQQGEMIAGRVPAAVLHYIDRYALYRKTLASVEPA